VVTAVHLYRVGRWFYVHRVPILPRFIYAVDYLLFNVSVPASAEIGKGPRFGYGGMRVIIHSRAVIGESCLIGHEVTIGGRSHILDVPTLGDRVYVGAGAKILGNVHVGDSAVVGANAVVIHSVPAHSVVGGMPARVIKENIDINDYI